MKRFPQGFTLEDNRRVILEFESLLRHYGLEIPLNSPLEKASLGILEMEELAKNKAIHNLAVDCRESWRQALSHADIARKVLKAQHHPDFRGLLSHVGLLLETSNLSQLSAIPITASPKEQDTNNKIFELFVAAILFQVCSNLEFDNPRTSKGDNPDVIGEFEGNRWGFACKVSHSQNPKTFLDRVRDGIDQIEAAKVDRGLILVNIKNLVPHDELWPAQRDQQTGEWQYAAYLHKDALVTRIQQNVGAFADQVYDSVGGRDAFVGKFSDTNVVPTVLVFSCALASHAPKAGIVGPIIVRLVSGIGVPFEKVGSETKRLMDSFNDHLHDRLA